MLACFDNFQIGEVVVAPIVVFVVDHVARRNCAVVVRPHPAMKKALRHVLAPGLKVATACLNPKTLAFVKDALDNRHSICLQGL